MLSPVLVLATVAVGLVPAAAELAAARWPRRSPAAAIMLWQAMGLGWGVAAIGTLAALGADPEGPGVAGGALTVLDRAVRNVTGEVRPPALPAVMRLLGPANWWAPGPLRRLYARYGIREADPAGRGPAQRPVSSDSNGPLMSS